MKHKKDFFFALVCFSFGFWYVKENKDVLYCHKNNTYRMCNEILTRLRQGFLKYEHNFCASYTTHSHSFLFTHSLTYSLSYKYSSSCRLLKQNFSNFAKDKVFCVIFFFSFSLSTISKQFYTIFVCDKQTSIKLQRSLKKRWRNIFQFFFL